MVERYRRQQDASIDEGAHTMADTVTVVDPCHPFFDSTFPLLNIVNRPDVGCCCLVKLKDETTRLVPLSMTNLSPEKETPYPIPLSTISLEELINAYSRIFHQPQSPPNESEEPYSPEDS